MSTLGETVVIVVTTLLLKNQMHHILKNQYHDCVLLRFSRQQYFSVIKQKKN